MRKSNVYNICSVIFFVILIIIAEYLFFHNVIGTDACLGDTCDGRLTALISEHWYQFFIGNDSLTEVHGMFYPTDNVLSHSDIMLGVGIIHSLMRALGAGIFTAYKYSLIIIHATGSLSLLFYLYHCKKNNIISSFLGVVFFSYSNILLLQGFNTQLFCVSFLVIELIFLHYFIHSGRRVVRLIHAVLLGVNLSLQFYTAYYVAFMGALQLFIIAVVLALMMIIRDRQHLLDLLKRWYEFVVAIACFILSMIPFVLLYIPRFRTQGGTDYDSVYVTHLSDLFYNGFDKTQDSSIEIYSKNYSVLNHTEFFPVVTASLFGVLLILTLILIIIKRTCTDNGVKPYVIISLIISTAVIFIIGISINDFSLWRIIYTFIPGASVLRAGLRWHLILMLPLSVLTAFMTDYIYNLSADRLRYLTAALILIATGIIWLDNYNPSGALSSYNSTDSESFISYVKKPPLDAEVFYIKNGDEELGNRYIESVTPLIPSCCKIDMDALYISAYYNLKTINGYSGGTPKGWDIVALKDTDTDSQVADWIKLSGIDKDKVYVYGMRENAWHRARL